MRNEEATASSYLIVATGLLKCVELNCYLLNACSILNKLSDLETFLHMNTPAFVGISETLMYPELNHQMSLFAQIVKKFFFSERSQ